MRVTKRATVATDFHSLEQAHMIILSPSMLLLLPLDEPDWTVLELIPSSCKITMSVCSFEHGNHCPRKRILDFLTVLCGGIWQVVKTNSSIGSNSCTSQPPSPRFHFSTSSLRVRAILTPDVDEFSRQARDGSGKSPGDISRVASMALRRTSSSNHG